ncbi:YiiD C-terminal domain-containing protein [Plectonema cf. radiosum LEGE 06105]|uniref:YiiD C-terminal domain-containing protein n=1 Tax=Plectonema cf. radiosum LEGE 06105 TaxID=945769 RepID=A0A8J7F4B5_9CYAN|nr:YiiD C-terminal domain-containing protein [Plectonema radiosum]MBE9214892.1 YiiD C-terminal domain-containing protein [Plectonema cf. radiosum LEGE 06105]
MFLGIAEVESYLHQHIPLSKYMEVKVKQVDQHGVTLQGALTPNINHRSTVFGGSVCALAILSGWTLVHANLQALSLSSRIVIQRNSIEYLQPINGNFIAFCPFPSEQIWQKFIKILEKKSKSRIELNVDVFTGGMKAANFTGVYVAIN